MLAQVAAAEVGASARSGIDGGRPNHTAAAHADALRGYQRAALTEIDAAFAGGRRAPLLVLPTGAGKTAVAADLMHQANARGERALFLAPRRELVHQASRALARLGLRHGLILAGERNRLDHYAQAHVGSIDTLLARMVRRSRLALAAPSLVIVDEAHLGITAQRARLFSLWPDARRVGLTATPTRKDGRALGNFYDALIETATTASLTAQGILAPARYFSLSEPDLSRVRTVAGDYNGRDLDGAVNRPHLVADVVATWLARGAMRRTVVFGSSIGHSVALCAEFRRAGVAAAHVDATTPQAERDDIFARFSCGETQLLTNCFLASYGFDLPDLSCVVLARPTKSLAMYMQMVGRGLRVADGKSDCLVLDHSGAVHRHGFATDERCWTLDGEFALQPTQSHERPVSEQRALDCPQCRCTFSGGRECPECGHYFAPRAREVVTLDGELIEVGQLLAPDAQDRLIFFLELRGFAAENGYKSGWAAHRFRERFDDWPRSAWVNTAAVCPSIETRRWLQSRFIAYRKAKLRAASA